jgi:hypothetical protein
MAICAHQRPSRQKRGQHAEEYALEILGGQTLFLTDDYTISWILRHIKEFVSQSRGNTRIQQVVFRPRYACDRRGDGVWDKLGQAIGNLEALDTLTFAIPIFHNPAQNLHKSDWGGLNRTLSCVRRNVRVNVTELDDGTMTHDHGRWAVEDVQALGRAICGHPSITSFDSGRSIPHKFMDSLFSALATVSSLKSINISYRSPYERVDNESALVNPESLTRLLRSPSLRSACFEGFYFKHALCRALANVLAEGMAVTKLAFAKCSFSALECAGMIANGLSRNTSLSQMKVAFPLDQALSSALATALPSNSTLQDLSLMCSHYCTNVRLSPVFSALEKNTGLKSLKVSMCQTMDESLCTAITRGLGRNESIESLDLLDIYVTDENSDLWEKAFSFLGIHKALKSLKITLQKNVPESRVSAFRIDIMAMLEENASLESLSIGGILNRVKADEYIALVTALQHNKTLKTLSTYYCNGTIGLTDDEDKQIAKLLKRNYTLESLLDIKLKNKPGDVGAMLRLNAAGRRYLIEDGSSISKGVEVLCAVSNEINCVFLHLLENPTLCDRDVVESVSARERKSRSTSPTDAASSVGGKREPAILHGGKESRRRLA